MWVAILTVKCWQESSTKGAVRVTLRLKRQVREEQEKEGEKTPPFPKLLLIPTLIASSNIPGVFFPSPYVREKVRRAVRQEQS